jgi:hypothetical protein
MEAKFSFALAELGCNGSLLATVPVGSGEPRSAEAIYKDQYSIR